MNKILVVEDEEAIAALIRMNLTKAGYQCDLAFSGDKGADMLSENNYDLCLLDIMLPGFNGYELLSYAKSLEVPVIFVTAKGTVEDKVKGLKSGADDYITKPFNILEVKARIKAIIRRSSVTETKEPPKVYSYNGLRIDIESRRGYINDKEVNLTAKEFDLLELLMLHPNKVYGREELLNTVWGYDYPGDVRTVDVHIRRLREKIEESPSNPVFIHTKWGVGYYFQK